MQTGKIITVGCILAMPTLCDINLCDGQSLSDWKSKNKKEGEKILCF